MICKFSQHAREQMQRRGIDEAQVLQVLNAPDKKTEEDRVMVYQAAVDFG